MEKKKSLFSITLTREVFERVTILVKAENQDEARDAAQVRMNVNPLSVPIETELGIFYAYAADTSRVANVGQAVDFEV